MRSAILCRSKPWPAALAIGCACVVPFGQSQTVTLDRILEETSTPPGYETPITSLSGADTASNGRTVVVSENFVPADFVTTFLDTERDRVFGGLPGATGILFADETSRAGRFQRGLGGAQINAAGAVAYGASPNDEDLNSGGPDDGVFFRSSTGTDLFFGAEIESVPAGYGLPGATQFRSLDLIDLADDGSVYIRATYATTFTATLNAPGTSRDGQSGIRYDQALLRWNPTAGTATPVLKTGDTIDFGPDPDQTVLWNAIQPAGSSSRIDVASLGSFDVARTATGDQSIAVLDINDIAAFGLSTIGSGAHFTNQLVVNNVAARLGDGTLIQTDVLVPTAFGGDGAVAVIEGIGNNVINAAGSWATLLTIGDPNANSSTDPFATQVVIRDGGLAYTLGDVVDGISLDQNFERFALNDDGDFAFLHGDTLFFNDQAIAAPGLAIQQGGSLASFSFSFSMSDRIADAGGEKVIFNFLGRDNTDPTGTPIGDDLYTLTLQLAAALAGDYNDSGSVEQGDLDLVLNNWGGPRTAGFVANADGFATANVDQEELDRVLNNWGSSNAPAFGQFSVPEPAVGIFLAAFAAFGLTRPRSVG